MDLTCIEDILNALSDIPGIGHYVDELRFAYDTWRQLPDDLPDPHPILDQVHTLGDLHTRAKQLTGMLNDSLLALRQNWTGNRATMYLGPEPTAFQVEHGTEPGIVGIGYQLWDDLNLLTYLLDYNREAHQQGYDYLNRLSSCEDDLTSQLSKVAIDFGAIVGGPKVPLFEVPEILFEGHEIDAAYDTAQQLSTLLKKFSQPPQIADTIPAPAPTEIPFPRPNPTPDPTASPSYVLIIVGAIVVILLVALIIYAYNRAHNNNPSKYEMLLEQYGDPVLARYLADAGLTDQQCQELINQFGLLKLQELAKLFQSNGIPSDRGYFLNLYQARNVPGIKTVLEDILRSNSQSGLKGGLFELQWIAAHADEIVQLQLPGKDGKGRIVKGPDAKLNDPAGTLIQLKSFTWGPSYNSANIKSIISQLATTRRSYPNEPIEFIFDSTGKDAEKTTKCLPDSVVKRLEAAGIYPAGTVGATVTWDYWPPGNCTLPTHDPV
jgi:hypothetical protein